MLPMTSTIWAYNEYLDGGLFANAVFPDNIDKDIAIDTILLNAGEFEPLYKDAEFMQHACEVWAKKWYHAFERWALALSEEYNPLHNYDRWEEIEEEHDDTTTNKLDASTSTKDTNTNKRSAYKGKFERKAHLFGNIGVTTSATMLTEELEVRKHNLYNMIADCFAAELTLMVY